MAELRNHGKYGVSGTRKQAGTGCFQCAQTGGHKWPSAQPHPALSSFQGLLSVCSSDHRLDSTADSSCCPLEQEGDAPEPPYLWLCDLPPWGTCRLPTTCASEFLGGCSPAAGEWPGQTHPGKPNLWGHRRAQNTGCKCPVRHHSAPFPSTPPGHSARLTSGGEGQTWQGSLQEHGSPPGWV